jgi:hypothetical protein
LDPALNNPNFAYTPPTTFNVSMVSQNNLPIAYYNDTIYEEAKAYKKAYVAA